MPCRFARGSYLTLAASAVALACAAAARAADATGPVADLVGKFCLDCHDAGTRKGEFSLEGLNPANPAAAPLVWEKVLRKLDHRQMPPLGEARPTDAAYRAAATQLASALDRAAATKPDPGRVDTFRRLTRTEYQNSIRDLLGVEIDATALLPQDEPALGFDNVTVGALSPTLMDRYVTAAQKIARLAVGTPAKIPGGDTFRTRADVTQEAHLAGLPLGTRGGMLIPYTFPQDGTYEIQVRLSRDRNEQVEGLRKPHDFLLLLDREQVAQATVKPPGADRNAEIVDQHLNFRVRVAAGPHAIGATFLKNPTTIIETEREPYQVRFNMHRHPRQNPAVYQVSITGPFDAKAPGDSPSRRKIFGSEVARLSRHRSEGATADAHQILARLARLAYRRPISDEDMRKPLQFFRDGSAEGAGFAAGVEHALAAILVSPRFLIRVEQDPPDLAPGTAYRINDFELATRLAFFLWSSLPDDALLDAATRGDLRKPALLEAQVRRMLADERSRSLVTNFASQWLHLRALESVAPDLRLFINFDDNLRQALREETERFVESIFREDRPIADLLTADYTFLNERLARHYRIPHIHGSHFRRISFAGDPARQRGGLLRQGSILTVTSYATRTSPVIRGKWILDNLLGTPPPSPPGDVPSLDQAVISATLPIRQRLAAHREKPACASCHNTIDPIGFALENFDAIGRWRTEENHVPVDTSSGLPDGTVFAGVGALEQALAGRPELFAGNVAEKLLIFALGRGVEAHDAPAVREILRRAQKDDYRFSALILALVNSPPFQMRKTPSS